MYGNTTLIQQNIAHNGYGGSEATLRRRYPGVRRYWRLRMRASWHAFWATIFRQRRFLLALDEILGNRRVSTRRHLGLQSVPLSRIVGSEGRNDDFDADFRPCKSHNQDRWVGIATARLSGIPLPPVELIQIENNYFVRDGNHRISVALSLGQTEIDANVTLWEMDGS